jgi:hypothetical protein
MTIQKPEALKIARDFVASTCGSTYTTKQDWLSTDLIDSDSFSRSLGVDCRYWRITFEYCVPEGVVLCPDEVTILVAETTGKATLATLM